MKLSLSTFILVALFFASQADAKVFFTIDSFASSQPPLVFIVPAPGPTAWYSIYNDDNDDTNDAAFAFHATNDCLGGERDLFLGHESETPQSSVAILSIVSQRMSVAFPLAYVGGAYFQWDGIDSGAGTAAFPGANLSINPGIGSGISATLLESNGNKIDFTSSGQAYGIGITISADHEVNYFLDFLDTAGNLNTMSFTHEPTNEDTEIRYFFKYSDASWSDLTFDFSDVAAFQVRIFTFSGAGANAIDTDFFNLQIIGYEVLGNVFLDCGCVGVPDSFIASERVDLFLSSQPSTVIDFTFTDVNGDFEFLGLDDGTYIVCLNDLLQDLCTPITGCRTFTLAGQVDPAVLTYSISEISGLTAPPDVTIECGSCQTVACLGSATATVCGGGSAPVTTFTDGPITGSCTRTFVRTFSDQGNFASQRITIVDTTNPSVVTPASFESRICSDNLALSYSGWLAVNGNAVFSDCSAISVTNNAGASDPCGTVSVIFTATDVCGNSASSTGSYQIVDNQPPTFTNAPQSQTAQCDASGNSDFNAFNAWLSSNGGATFSDACSSSTISNNFVPGSLVRGCAETVVVIYTVTDGCGNSDSRSASFTIEDVTGPSISPQASNQSAQCNSNTVTTFNTWLSSNGGAGATDDCGSAGIVFSNNFVGGAPFGCGASATVVFTATDGCFQSASTTATFNVVDTIAPVLTTPAANFSSDCANQGNDLNNWLNDDGGARANDACDGAVSFTNNFNSLPSTDCGGTPVVFTACDTCANCVSSTASFSIVDLENPVFIIPPSSQSVECDSADTQASYDSWVNSVGGATFSDNCALSSELTIIDNAPANAPVITGSQCSASVTVAYRVSDPCGNQSAAVTAAFTVNDSFAPTITSFPLDQTEACASSNNSAYTTWRNSRAGADAVDSCSSVTWTNNGPNSFTLTSGDCIDSQLVTFTASDACGNAVAVTASFTIVDNTPPTMSVSASDDFSECNSSAFNSWLADNGGARATDACSAVSFTNNFIAFSGGCTETAFVTFTATDACGNAVDSSATYSIVDTTSPSINPRASNLSVPCDNNTGSELSTWLNTQGGAVASDACQDDLDLFWTDDFNSAVVGCDFATVTFTVTDACGNTAATTATFTSVDNDPPTFSPGASNTVVECNGSGNTADYSLFLSTRGGSVPVDQCALSFTFSNNAPVNGPASCGSQTVIFTVEDECNNSASTTAIFTVQDSFAPVFQQLPNNINVECDGAGNVLDRNTWVSGNGGATASDTCSGTVTWSQTIIDSQGDNCNAVDIYQFTAFDTCGNSDFVTASFTVHDFSAPTITVDPSDISFECDGNGNLPQITSWINDSAGARGDDLCQGGVSFTNDFNGLGLFTCVSSTVLFTATDGCGNTVSRSAIVSITDNTSPVFSFFPDDVTIPCDADASTDVLGFATSFDVCAGDLFVSMSEVSFDEPPIGDCPGDHIITRTFSAFDDCGNSVTRDQVVTVVIARASGPCDPEGCECDDCCPPAAASDCLPVNCQAAQCTSSPCEASLCTCDLTSSKSAKVSKRVGDDAELPQCKPVYIYVNDDDDTPHDFDGVAKQPRMLVSNEALHM